MPQRRSRKPINSRDKYKTDSVSEAIRMVELYKKSENQADFEKKEDEYITKKRTHYSSNRRNLRGSHRLEPRKTLRKSYEDNQYRAVSTEQANEMIERAKAHEKHRDKEVYKEDLNDIIKQYSPRRSRTNKIKKPPPKKRSSREPRRNKANRNTRRRQKSFKVITMNFKRRVNNRSSEFIKKLIGFVMDIYPMEVDDLNKSRRNKNYHYSDMVHMFKEKTSRGVNQHPWEQTHSSIQWIFPTNQRSRFAGQTSPILPRKDEFIRVHGQEVFNVIGNIIEKSVDAYLYYLENNGFLELVNDHNFLRITRVAGSLQYFNKHDKAMDFLDKILRDAINANKKSKEIWQDKLNDIRRDKENIG